jgi:hypothetical protein
MPNRTSDRQLDEKRMITVSILHPQVRRMIRLRVVRHGISGVDQKQSCTIYGGLDTVHGKLPSQLEWYVGGEMGWPWLAAEQYDHQACTCKTAAMVGFFTAIQEIIQNCSSY